MELENKQTKGAEHEYYRVNPPIELLRGREVPLPSLNIVLRHTLARGVHPADEVLRIGMTLIRHLAKRLHLIRLEPPRNGTGTKQRQQHDQLFRHRFTHGWMGWDHTNFAQIRPVYAMMNPGALVAGKGNARVGIACLRVGQMLRALVRGDPGGGDYPCP